MACYHPLNARFRTPAEIADGLSRGIKRSLLNRPIVKGELTESDLDIVDTSTGEVYSWFKIPCDKCIGCRLAFSREWANRNTLESLCYDEDVNKFLTFTYDNSFVPVSSEGVLTTNLDHISEFNKNLRAYYDYNFNHQGVRFYATSEYGSTTLRPHYHASYFNLPIPDLKRIATNFRGDPLYSSELINKIWGKGFVVIGDFAWNTAAYTARYIVKKLKGEASLEYSAFGLEPENSRMSRRPGIGNEWMLKNQNWIDVYNTDEIVLPSNGSKANAVKPPKSFDRALEEIDPIRLAKIKANRARAAEMAQKARLDQSGYTEKEYFSVAELKQSLANKKLLRIFQDLS